MQPWAAHRGGFLVVEVTSYFLREESTRRVWYRYLGEFEGKAVVIDGEGNRSFVEWERCSLPPSLA